MRLVFINRQGKIMVHELPKVDVDTCQVLLDAFSHDNVLQYYKAVSEMDIAKNLAALDYWFRLVPDYKREGYLNLVDEILPDAFKVLKYGLCNLVKPHVPEELYTFLTNDEIVTRYCLHKPDKNTMCGFDYRYSVNDGLYYIHQLKPLKDSQSMLVVRNYDGNPLDEVEVKEGDLILPDISFRKVGEEYEFFGLEGDAYISNMESIEIGLMFNADTKEGQESIAIDPGKKYGEVKEKVSLMNAKKDRKLSKEHMEKPEGLIFIR